MKTDINKLYHKVLNGDHITDEELTEGLEFFNSLSKNLGQLGERFHLSWAEAWRIWDVLDGYQRARQRKSCT